MIRARRSPVLVVLLHWILRWVMRRRFFAVVVEGWEHAVAMDPHRSVVACANHSNWWDGFVAFLLCESLGHRKTFLAQDEDKLRENAFFRFTGAFGVAAGRRAAPGLRYALGLLVDPAACVWIFPQGDLQAQDAPIEVRPGALFLARKSGSRVWPVAFRYEWFSEAKPTIVIRCGVACDPCLEPGELAAIIAALRDVPPDPASLLDGHFLVRPHRSLNKVWSDVCHKIAGHPIDPSPWNRWHRGPSNDPERSRTPRRKC